MKPSVITIESTTQSLPKVAVPGIQSYHSAKINEDNITFWKYHGIGFCKEFSIDIEDLEIDIKYSTTESFPSKVSVDRVQKQRVKKTTTDLINSPYSIFCPDPECTPIFSSMTELEDHFITGVHQVITHSSKDMMMLTFAKRLKTSGNECEALTSTERHESSDQNRTANMIYQDYYQRGWAIKRRKPAPRFNEKQCYICCRFS